ncbi:MAG: hypothetical protein SCJ97_02300 [Bacillota bacterium]|nr:hypothetical protein [Bacillota bacterium]
MYKVVNKFDFRLTTEDVLKGQGIDPDRASDRLIETAESVIETAESLLKPAAMYILARVSDFEHQKVTFEGGSFEGSLVARAMAGAKHLYIGLCTIGEDLELKVEEMMNENPVLAIALDGAGISAVRKVSETVEDIISAETCELKLSLGMRAQPGQEGWPLEQQRQVFEILPGEEIGVRLTESCLMIPRKSVTFVIPRGKELGTSVVPCDFCSKRNRCDWRKEKQAG